jgi:hypothetical protein
MTPSSSPTCTTVLTWSAFFNAQNQLVITPETEVNNNKTPTQYILDNAKLYQVVTWLQETAALLIPSAGKSIRSLHHCFADLARDRILGISGLRKYSPFKEVSADAVVAPLNPPLRDSKTTKVPTFDEFTAVTTSEEFSSLVGTLDHDAVNLREQASLFWVSPDMLSRYYDKTAKAADITERIIKYLVDNPSEAMPESLQSTFYEQLVFLWAVEKGYTTGIPVQDPPDSEQIQATIEETHGLLVDSPSNPSGPAPHNRDNEGRRPPGDHPRRRGDDPAPPRNSTPEINPNQIQDVETTQGLTTGPDRAAPEGGLDLSRTGAGVVNETTHYPHHEGGPGLDHDRDPDHPTATLEALTDETTSLSPPLSKGSRR